MLCRTTFLAPLMLLGSALIAAAQPPKPTIEPLVRAVDLNLGQAQEVRLCDGRTVQVKLLDLKETADPLRAAVRNARVEVEIDGQRATLTSANYRLPVIVGKVRIDCPITKGFTRNSSSDAWGLEKDARLRLWPAGSPLMNPGTFVYPIRQRFFASSSQMANEPCYVDHGDQPKVKKIYYHYGLDFGGCEGMTEIQAATDGLVVSARKDALPGYKETPVAPRYDVVYVLDGRGWFYRYSHFNSIDKEIKPGIRVKAGQRLGLLGKEGGSGGWSHFHFDIFCRQPSGKWGCQEAFGFVWEAYQKQYQPKLIAVARPHQLVLTGQPVELDASRSWSADGKIARWHWIFTDGTTAEGPKVQRTYARPGYYSEAVQVTDAAGRSEYDFAIVIAVDPQRADHIPLSVHVVHHPTLGIRAGDEVTLKARTFGTTTGQETWDFGDGSPKLETKSDGNVVALAKDGYVVVKHRFERPGHYLVRVQRTDEYDQTAVGCIHVAVEPRKQQAESVPSDAPEVKELEKERVEMLARLVDLLLAQFDSGTGAMNFTEFAQAQTELIGAILDYAEKPDQRIALLEQQLKTAERMLRWTEKRATGGQSSGANALRAKALCLDIKIKLVRERAKLKAPAK